MWGDVWGTCWGTFRRHAGELVGGHAGGGCLKHVQQNSMLLRLSVIRALHCEWGSRYQLGGGVQNNPNLPTIAQQKGVFNPHPARTLLRPPSNTERSACSASVRLSSFYIHINLHLILNSPNLTQIFCSPIQFTSLGLIQKHTSFTAYTHTPTPASALSIFAKRYKILFVCRIVGT